MSIFVLTSRSLYFVNFPCFEEEKIGNGNRKVRDLFAKRRFSSFCFTKKPPPVSNPTLPPTPNPRGEGLYDVISGDNSHQKVKSLMGVDRR